MALRRGVRVIELDIWSNSKKDGIHVCHGGILTSRVELSKCLFAIREYAFFASDYPVIITFEDHLDLKLQAEVAEMVAKIFRDMLYCPMKELTKFPSPNSLKHKILISTRPPKETKTEYNKDSSSNQDDDDDDEEKTIPKYKHLISIRARKRKGGFRKTLASECDYVRRVTFSEPKLLNDIKDYGTDIVKFTQRNLLRVHPKGTRIYVADVMRTKYATVLMNTLLIEAVTIMLAEKQSFAVITDDNNHLLGLISLTDVQEFSTSSVARNRRPEELIVVEMCSGGSKCNIPWTITPNMDIFTAQMLVVSHNLSQLYLLFWIIVHKVAGIRLEFWTWNALDWHTGFLQPKNCWVKIMD